MLKEHAGSELACIKSSQQGRSKVIRIEAKGPAGLKWVR